MSAQKKQRDSLHGAASLKPLGRKKGLGPIGFEAFLLISGILLFALSFPGYFSDNGLPVLGFIALVPMFALIRMSSWKLIVPYALVYGFASYTFFNYWLSTFHPLAIFIAPVIVTAQVIVMFPVVKLIGRAFPRWGYILQAVAFVAYEYVRTLGFAGYPYGLIGYSIYTFLPVMQIAEITGVWGVSFLIALFSSFLGKLVVDWFEAGKPHVLRTLRSNVPFIAIYTAVFIGVVIFGFVRINQVNQWEVARHWKTALVQHNADTWVGGFQQYQRNFRSMRRLTMEALEEDPDIDIVVWSETAFVPGVYWHSTYRTSEQMYSLVQEFEQWAKTLDVPLVTGNSDGRLKDPNLPPVRSDGTLNRADYNAVIHYEAGELQEAYRKLHLVPFTEHFPYGEQMPRFYALLLANDFNFWEEGEIVTVFETKDGVRFSTPICFEDVFGYLPREFINAGAQVIVNLSNDSWSRAVSAQMQHYTMSLYRAIENRRGMVRSTNSGMTTTMDAAGQTIDMLDPFVEAYMITTVPIYADPPTTFYTKYGDWMAVGSLMATFILVAVSAVLMIRRRVRR